MTAILRIESDPKADALYVHISDKPVKTTREITPDMAVDFAEDNTPVGIDLQRVSELAKEYEKRPHRQEASETTAGVSVELVAV